MKKLFESTLKEMVGKAFSISPTGEILSVERHIQLIIENPDIFGYTKQEILDLYNKYHEDLGQEGKAREEIINQVIKKGWIRVRKYDRPEYWSINVYFLTKDVVKRLENLAKQIADKKIERSGSMWDEIKLLETKTGKTFIYTIKDITEFRLFQDLFESIELEECSVEQYREKRALYHCNIEEYRLREKNRIEGEIS